MEKWLRQLVNSRCSRTGRAVDLSRKLRLESLESRQLLTTFYVDGPGGDGTIGNDLTGNGLTLETAFRTIQRASTFARPGDSIQIRGGIYRQSVDPFRDGTAGNLITYEPYNGESVIISGGDVVTGWTQHNGDIWRATANWNANNDRNANTLFVDGNYKFEGRQYGENDLLDIDDWGLLKQGRLQSNADSFVVDDLGGFGDDFWNGAKIKFHTFDYALATKTIADFDAGTGRITLDSPIGVASQKQDNGYYIYDALQAVDKPGEWYKEDGGNTLYYQVSPGQNPNDMEIELKNRAFGFDLSSSEYVHIKDLEFRGVSIQTDGNTAHNLIEGNQFYAYDKGNYGRFTLSGNHNVIRDNEFSQTWSSFVIVGGLRNEIVNNYIHDIGYGATARVITATDAEELLVSHNTVQKFARSFMDGYPSRSEIAYNVFEDAGRLTWDTGVFDADGGNGDSSYSIFHHNVFRDTETRGIFEAFYGGNNNAVVHHNLFYNFNQTSGRTVFRSAGLDFRQSYHNTFITDVDSAPEGSLNALDSIQTRYNNNVQISMERMEALGIDVRGNHNFSTSDFVNFNNNDYQLAAGSNAIDAGIVLPGINDGYLGAAPDAGAFEFGQPAWHAGHNFVTEPNPVFSWTSLPGTNLYLNGQFRDGIGDWTTVSGSPSSQDRNSWNLSSSGASLTGTFRTESVELNPDEGIRRSFTGLTPNTTYTLGTAARVANQVIIADQFAQSSGSITTDSHRDVDYVTGISPGEWVRYDNIDFGDAGQFDLIDVLHIRDPADGFSKPIGGAIIQVRLDNAAGPVLAEFSQLNDGNTVDRWRANRESFASVSGVHSVYVSTSGANSQNLAIGSFRLLKENPPTTDLLTVRVSPEGANKLSAQIGGEDWERGYSELSFRTGPAGNSAEVEIFNHGRLNAYLDRLYLIDGYATRGAEPRDLSTGGTAEFSVDATTSTAAPNLVDGTLNNLTLTGDHPNSWMQIDLLQTEGIHGVRLTPPAGQLDRMSNFRVSAWSGDPDAGGVELWGQDYLTDGRSLGEDETLTLLSSELDSDGVTTLGTVAARFVRVQLLGQTNSADFRLGMGELQVLGFDETNLALSDGTPTQSTTSVGLSADNAIDGDDSTISETQSSEVNSWWQVRFPQTLSIGEIELVNRDDSSFNELSNFTVSVWDEDPRTGGAKLWEKSYFSSGSVGQGQSLVIDGGEIGADGVTRLATAHRGRVVRVQINGTNNAGNGTLALANVRVTSGAVAKPQTNVALEGTADQSNDFYGDVGTGGFAFDANDGVVQPISNFTSTLNEFNAWWQVDLQQATPIDQIVLFNRQDAANRLNNFRVSVWDANPSSGSTELWGRNYNYSSSAPYYSTNSITAGGALLINGSVEAGGVRLDELTDGRFVRVQLNGANLLSLVEVQVWKPEAEPTSPGDFNGDGKVDGLDLAKWQIDYAQNAGSDADLDVDSDGFDFLLWQQNYAAAPVETFTTLIDSTTGNGEFAVDNVNDVASVGGGGEPLDTNISRDRALRGTSGFGRGVSIAGWQITRQSYSGANAALGTDGLFGFATNAGSGPGQTGQVFVNSGVAKIESSTINHTFLSGDVVDLSYLLGSDSGGGTGTAYADVQLVFDQGLLSQFTHTFPQASGTGVVVNSDTMETEQYTLTQSASTLTLSILLEGGNSTSGIRGLLDNVELSVSSVGALATQSTSIGMAAQSIVSSETVNSLATLSNAGPLVRGITASRIRPRDEVFSEYVHDRALTSQLQLPSSLVHSPRAPESEIFESRAENVTDELAASGYFTEQFEDLDPSWLI